MGGDSKPAPAAAAVHSARSAPRPAAEAGEKGAVHRLEEGALFAEDEALRLCELEVGAAGGIGLQLSDRIRINNWDEALFIILMILVTVAVIDYLSERIRHRLIQGKATRQ